MAGRDQVTESERQRVKKDLDELARELGTGGRDASNQRLANALGPHSPIDPQTGKRGLTGETIRKARVEMKAGMAVVVALDSYRGRKRDTSDGPRGPRYTAAAVARGLFDDAAIDAMLTEDDSGAPVDADVEFWENRISFWQKHREKLARKVGSVNRAFTQVPDPTGTKLLGRGRSEKP